MFGRCVFKMWTTRMETGLGVFTVLAMLVCSTAAAECPSFSEFFSKCRWESPTFDDCLVGALNRAKVCYHVGDPSLNIPPFEPLRYGEITGEPVTQNVRSAGLYSVRAILPNITEWAWGNSTYTKVKTDFKRKYVQIYQTVPYKHVVSDGIVSGEILGIPFSDRQGDMLLDYTGVKQRFTIQIQPNGKLKVNLVILSFNEFKLEYHRFIHDDVGEKVFNESMRRFWKLGYNFFKRIGYEISDKAKTLLFNQLFRQIDWNGLFGTSVTNPSSNYIGR